MWNLVVVLLVVLLGMASLILLGAYGAALYSLVFVGPLLVSIFLCILTLGRGATMVEHRNLALSRRTKTVTIGLLVALFISSEIVLVGVRLMSAERTLIYFAIQTVALLSLSIQIFVYNLSSSRRISVILAEIGILVAFNDLAMTLPFPYYLGNTDAVFHSHWAQQIIADGHIGKSMGGYIFFPAMHVLTASLSEVVPWLSTAQAVHVIFAVLGFAMPFVVYSISSGVTSNKSYSILVAFFVSLGYVLLAYRSDAMPYCLAYVFSLFILLASIRIGLRREYGYVGIVFIIVLVFTHQVSVPYIILVLTVALLVLRQYGNLRQFNTIGSFSFIKVLVVVFIAYSAFCSIQVYGSLLLIPVQSADVDLSTSPISAGALVQRYLVNSLFSFMLFLCFLGIFSYTGYSYPFKRLAHSRLLLCLGLVSLFFYIPGISSLSPAVDLYLSAGLRHALFAEPVAMAFVAVAIVRNRLNNQSRRRLLLAIVVSLVVLGGVIYPVSLRDTFVFDSGPKPKVYLDREELAGTAFVEVRSSDRIVETDYYCARFLEANGVNAMIPSVGPNNSIPFPPDTLALVRVSQLESHALYFYNTPLGQELRAQSELLYPVDIDLFRSTVNVVYDSGGIIVTSWFEVSALGDYRGS